MNVESEAEVAYFLKLFINTEEKTTVVFMVLCLFLLGSLK